MAAVKPDVYTAIADRCTAEQIREVMRQYKDVNKETKKEILLTSTKEDLVANLKRAVSKRMIPQAVPIELLRHSEEHGHQHIFYFKPAQKNVVAVCRDGATIGEAVGGANWAKRFPEFDFVPGKYRPVDFRIGCPGKPRDWVFKVYGHETWFKLERIERPTDTQRIEYFSADIARTVCLARWNDPDILEIRIDSERLNSAKTKNDRLATMWKMLAPAIKSGQFVPWELENTRTYMTSNRTGNADYEIGDLCLIDDDQGSATFKTCEEDESIDKVDARARAIDELAGADGITCNALRVHWNLPGKSAAEESSDKLNTVCGGSNSHELSVRSRTTGIAIDHVTNKLREFDEAAS